MCPPVSLQLVAPGEPLAAEHPVADERSLSAVPAQVSSEMGRLPVNLPAAGNVADMLLLLPHARPSVKRRETCGKRRKYKYCGLLLVFLFKQKWNQA